MLMLEDDEEFWRDEYDAPAVAPKTTAGQDGAVRQKPPPGRETREPGREARAPDINLDKFLAGMPGVPMLPESEMLDEMLVSILHTHTLRSPLGMNGSALQIQRSKTVCECLFHNWKKIRSEECMLADTAADT